MRFERALTVIAALLVSAEAMERHWPVAKAELIVIGAFHPNRAMPWFDGWHVSGAIEVNEVLWGPANAQTTIQMAYVDPWCQTCEAAGIAPTARAFPKRYGSPVSSCYAVPTADCGNPSSSS